MIDQIDTQEINVAVPLEERSSRYTNRQHHMPQLSSGAPLPPPSDEPISTSVIRKNSSSNEKPPVMQAPSTNNNSQTSVVSKKAPLSFKLDLAKV